jgi:uncharacterized pyridoxal phosphate-containing UPF0001 family protein
MKLSNACEAAGRSELCIYIQVDTSGEDTKSGVPPSGTSIDDDDDVYFIEL